MTTLIYQPPIDPPEGCQQHCVGEKEQIELARTVMGDTPESRAMGELTHVFHPILIDEYPELEYSVEVEDAYKKLTGANHNGQRKLFLAGVELLTCLEKIRKPGDKRKTVFIYAGAAPGTNIPLISSLFPDVIFELIDPAMFSIEGTSKIIITNDYYTEEMSKYFKKKYDGYRIAFMSDIRLVRTDVDELPTLCRRILSTGGLVEDMLNQFIWAHKLQPTLTSFKFKLPFLSEIMLMEELKKAGPNGWFKVKNRHRDPVTRERIITVDPTVAAYASDEVYWKTITVVTEMFNGGTTFDYPPGDIHFQSWSPECSAETRLMVYDINKKKTYNAPKYERQMFYYNIVGRDAQYDYWAKIGPYDRCHNCTLEQHILEDYFSIIRGIPMETSEMADTICDMQKLIVKRVAMREIYKRVDRVEQVKHMKARLKKRDDRDKERSMKNADKKIGPMDQATVGLTAFGRDDEEKSE